MQHVFGKYGIEGVLCQRQPRDVAPHGRDLLLKPRGLHPLLGKRDHRSRAINGRYADIRFRRGEPDEDIRRIFTKQITIYGSTMGTRHDWEQLNRLLAAKTFRPVVDRTFPLEQAAQAQTLLEHGEHFGKLVLTIPPLS